jgi:hypothetical protein
MAMSEISIFEVNAKLGIALKDLRATDADSAVRTRRLARRIRRLGLKAEALEIAGELEHLANTVVGRRYATFVGGTPDPLDQHLWALPIKQE